MSLSHNIDDVYDVMENVSMDTVTQSLPWEHVNNTASTPVAPLAHASMPMVRFICEVALSFPIAVFGICGNILAFVVLCNQQQRLTTNVLLQALAIADTAVLVSSILLRSMRYVGWDDYNDIHHYIFVILYPCVYFFRLADTWLTVMMTIDRYIAVCHPLKAQRLCTLHRTYVAIAVIVVATSIFSGPRFFEFRLTTKEEFSAGFIHRDFIISAVYTIAYRIVLFFLCMYLIPMTLLIVLNIKLLCALRTAYKHRNSMISNGSMHNGPGGSLPSVNQASRGVTIIVVTVVIVCVTCNVIAMAAHVFWALQICFFSLRYLEPYRRFLANISNIMVTFNCAINFVIYCLFSRKFRSGLRLTFRCEGLRRLSRKWRSDRQTDSNGTHNTSYTSLGRLPSRISLKNQKLAVQQKASTEL